MKPTFQFNARQGPRLPKTDYNYQSTSMADAGGRCFDLRRPSFRAISQDYFKTEARQSFAGEAFFFGVIVLTAAVPLLNTAYALVHLVHSFATV